MWVDKALVRLCDAQPAVDAAVAVVSEPYFDNRDGFPMSTTA